MKYFNLSLFRIITLFSFVSICNLSLAQKKDRKLTIGKMDYGDKWSPAYTTGRIGTTLQNRTAIELGIGRLIYKRNDFANPSFQYYAALEYIPYKENPKNSLYGIKMGADFTALFFLVGVDGKYSFDANHSHFIISPHFGLSLLNQLNVWWGANNIQGKGELPHGIKTQTFNITWCFNLGAFIRDKSIPIAE